MSGNHGLIDLTVDDESSAEDDGGGKGPSLEIPFAAFLPIGVDVTDDVVILDSDSENEQNIAETDVQAHFRDQRQMYLSRQPNQQGKFAHAKALEAAARKRKRKRAEEVAERKRIRAEEEAQRKRQAAEEATARKRLRAQETRERRRAEKQRKKEELEKKRKSEAEALRKNPPTGVNFVIIDSDPESDLTASRNSPVKQTGARKFHPLPRKRKPSQPKKQNLQEKQSKARERTPSSESDTPVSFENPTATAIRDRIPRPYTGVGANRVEFFRPTNPYRMDRDFNYKSSWEEAAADQDRLFRAAAERMRKKNIYAAPAHPPHIDLYGPNFDRVITDIHKLYPIHWTWKNPYSCLGLPPNAGLVQAKSQYRILVRAYHPDKSKEHGTSSKFHAVVLAFKKLQQATGNK